MQDAAPQQPFDIESWYADVKLHSQSGPEAVTALMGVLNKTSFRSRSLFHSDHSKSKLSGGGTNAIKKAFSVTSDFWQPTLEAHNNSGRRIYFVVNDGGDTWDAVATANNCRNHFCEFDSKHGVTPADALAMRWDSIGGVGFLEPAAIVYSGSVSPHIYFPLSEAYDDPFRWHINQVRLAQILGSDTAVCDLSRVMRLPGFFNTDAEGNKGREALLLYCHKDREHTISEFEEALAKVEKACGMNPLNAIPIGGTNRSDRRPGILKALVSIFGEGITEEFEETFRFNPKQKTLGSWSDYIDSRSLEEICNALDLIPPFVKGNNTFKAEKPVQTADGRWVHIDYFRLLAGLKAAWLQRGLELPRLIDLLTEKWTDVDQHWLVSTIDGANGSINPGSFWHFARVCGYKLTKDIKALNALTNSSPSAVTDPDSARSQVDEREKVINELMADLYKVMGASGDTFNRRESLRTQLSQGCGLSRELVSRRLLVMLGKEFGFNIGEENETDRLALPPDVQTTPTRDLIPGVLIEGRDAVVCAPPGCMKTTIAAMCGVYVTGGRYVPLATEDKPLIGKVIYIASDGGETAIPTVKSYAKRVGTPVENNRRWIFAGAHAGQKQSAWSYCFRDLKWLVEELEAHKDTDTPVRLIVIDTLRAVMDLAGLDSGIGPMNEAMRLMQGIAARYNAAVLWLHHTVKSNENVAAGHASITEIPNSVHFIHPTNRTNVEQPVYEWEVRKHRNAPRRTITYSVENHEGMQLVTADSSEEVQNLLMKEMMLELADGSSARNLSNYLSDFNLKETRVKTELARLRRKGLVKTANNRWFLTQKGMLHARELAQKHCSEAKLDPAIMKADDMSYEDNGHRKQSEATFGIKKVTRNGRPSKEAVATAITIEAEILEEEKANAPSFEEINAELKKEYDSWDEVAVGQSSEAA